MTEEEKKILQSLVEAHNLYCNIQSKGDEDGRDWEHYMHGLQRIIMSRKTTREHPEIFRQPDKTF